MLISLTTPSLCLPFHQCLEDFSKFYYSTTTKSISGVVVRLPSFCQLGTFLPHSSLVRNDCISKVNCVARPLLCNARVLCLLCVVTAVCSARRWPAGETYRQLDQKRHRDPSQNLGWKWNLNSQIIYGFRSVASTVPMIVLNDTSSA